MGFPRVQLSNDVHPYLLHRWIQVHHLVRYPQLVDKFLHTSQFSGELLVFAEQSGVDRNRTVVDAVIPPRQSNEARQRDTKARGGCDSRKPVRRVGTVFFPEPVTNAVEHTASITNFGGRFRHLLKVHLSE